MTPGGMSPCTATFFFPYHQVSGVPVLFARMARYLATETAVKVRVIDYRDGYQTRQLADVSGVELVEFIDGKPVRVGADECLLMQSVLPATVRPELQPSPDARLFFWTLHPLNLVQTLIPISRARDFQTRHPGWNRVVLSSLLRGHRNSLRRLVVAMHERHSLAFMDATTLESTIDRIGLEIAAPEFLAVPVDTSSGRHQRDAPDDPTIRAGWLGRLTDFKIHILAYSIQRLSAWAARSGRPVVMHVIGDGPEAASIRALGVEHGTFRLVFAGTLTGKALDDYLVSHVDLLMAMGTSALEGARLGIPTILLDISYGPIRGDYRYQWLYETRQLSLGEIIRADRLTPGNRSLEEKLEELHTNYATLSDRTYEYCVANHSVASVGARLEQLIRQADFRWSDVPPDLRRKSSLRRAYEWWRDRRRTIARANTV